MISASMVLMLSASADLPGVLVFSKTSGFRHGCIPVGVACIDDLGTGRWRVDTTEDSAEFAPGNLSEYDAVVFMNTTQDVLDEQQQAAFEAYLRNGGGWVGVHAAADTEYEWPFYGEALLGGAWFRTHPAIQEATVVVEDRYHPATAHLDGQWVRTDEWYDYRGNPRLKVHVLASLDETSYAPRAAMGDHPIIWTTPVGKGAAIYTGGGHTDETFAEPAFRTHLAAAIDWAIADGRIDLISPGGFKAWAEHSGWENVGDVTDDGRRLVASPGSGVLVNGDEGHAGELVTAAQFGDCEIHVEFMVPEGSNSGVYVLGRYEVQVLDSWGKPEAAHNDCGGIYQRWDEAREPKGFDGVPPRVNAARKPGRWQSFDIVFRAPRFDESGAKVEDARFVSVHHNGVLVHEDVAVGGPTRGGSAEESSTGPIRFQGDHGPVAYRNLKVRRLRLD